MMMLGTIVLSNYMNKFPSNSTERKEETEKKKIKTVHVIGDRVLPTALLPQHMATCELLFNQFLTNSGFHLNKIFPIFLIFLSHFHLSLRPIPSLSPSDKEKKEKEKTFPYFLSLQSPILQFPRRSRVSPQAAFESPNSIPSSAYRGFSVEFPLIR